jgi:type VI secretion system secreted protein Hcp
MGALDYFLKIEGIKGESQDSKHKDEIDVESFSWGVSQTSVRSGAGGAAAGKAQFQDFQFTMRINRASPALFLDCASGQHIKQAVFIGETTNTDSGASQFFKYTFSDVLVSSYQDAGSAGGVIDATALSFASVKVEATPGARVDITPAAFGNLMLDPNTGQPTVVEGQTGVLLSGPVVNVDGILIGLSRGIAEFSLADLLGLISGPQPHLHLVLTLQEVRGLVEQPAVDTNLAAAVTDLVTTQSSVDKPKKNTLRHNIYWYGPADLELTSDDFFRKGRRLGRVQLDLGGDALQQDFDLTDIVLDGNLDSIGIRIQSALDHAGPPDEEDDAEDVSEGESDASSAAAPNAAMFMLTLQAVAD